MTAREIFRRYRSERRCHSYGGVTLELLPHLSRWVANVPGADGHVAFADLRAEDAAKAIDEQVAHFEQLQQRFEWKIYEFDSPPTLKQLLEERGFRPEDEEAFLVLDAAIWIQPPRQPDGIRIEKITDRRQLSDYVAAEQEIWPEQTSSRLEEYARELTADPRSLSLYCAYLGDTPVGTGRVSFPARSSFADLNGGGVVSRLRGRGIFSALLSYRIEEAKARGCTWIAVDAAPMSRPILLRKGFQHICWTHPMRRGIPAT